MTSSVFMILCTVPARLHASIAYIRRICAFEMAATGSCWPDVDLSQTQRDTVSFIRPVRFPRQERELEYPTLNALLNVM